MQRIFIAVTLLIVSSCSSVSKHASNYTLNNGQLSIVTKFGKIQLTAFESGAIEVHVLEKNTKQLPSFAKKEMIHRSTLKVSESDGKLIATSPQLKAEVDTTLGTIDFYRGDTLLTSQLNYFNEQGKRGFNFRLSENEKIMGGGERVLGMDRRGQRMPLYNRAHYGYTTESNQMNFSMPAILSSKKYSVLFDNSANGFLDVGKTEPNTLTFEAVGGRTAYIVFAGNTFPETIEKFVEVTGHQPMPPRWALGNFASRFGYRTQAEVESTIDKFIDEDFPIDAVILDLYWFGKDIKGHMGKLDWDRKAFPKPKEMLEKLNEKGVNPILITEPFILKNSTKWQEAVDKKVLALDEQGNPRRYDFYFGNTGLIDVFDDNARQWFSQIYTGLDKQGVKGVWGDLGEPEVHPADTIHYLSDAKVHATGDEVHNAYGHEWAKMVFENQRWNEPNKRPFILMRSGFAGSQRYAMIPWTGDVSREWGGLKPQVELSLQMGVFGMAYTHSDLGGFAGGETFDKEMYIRWLQYGVFQPIYRPHAQDHIASEPVFHDKETKDITRAFIKLRYQLTPYLYTMTYQNSTTGMPLMRPMIFEDEESDNYFDIKDQYLWGDSLLIAPITEPKELSHSVQLPKGVWFNFWNEERYLGEQTVDIPVSLKTLPVLVRAGSFVPMVEPVSNMSQYSSKVLTLHYYADKTVQQSAGFMYEDDGESFDAIKLKKYELLNFDAVHNQQDLTIRLARNAGNYLGMSNERTLNIVVHNIQKAPKEISFDEQVIGKNTYSYNSNKRQLIVSLNWDHHESFLRIAL